MSFIGIHPFIDKASFDFWITDSIKRGQSNSLRRLETLVRATCLRRKKATKMVSLNLPSRSQSIETVDLENHDRALYTFFKARAAKLAAELSRQSRKPSCRETDGEERPSQRNDANILTLINFLRLICDHGEQLLPSSALEAWKSRDTGSIDWQMMQTCARTRCDLCGVYFHPTQMTTSLIDTSLQCQHSICSECIVTKGKDEIDMPKDSQSQCPKCVDKNNSIDHVIKGGSDILPFRTLRYSDIRPSAKVKALINNLRKEQQAETSEAMEQNVPQKR